MCMHFHFHFDIQPGTTGSTIFWYVTSHIIIVDALLIYRWSTVDPPLIHHWSTVDMTCTHIFSWDNSQKASLPKVGLGFVETHVRI